ncbi:SID1 transmembrane family member 1-like [Ptychodera flava]|uniref:SID1 transmembrane family member 1-like n=1 Tax=Ptychodera flava TaxID=63121 RepID=UPI00396AB104
MSWSFVSSDGEAEDLVYNDGDDINYRELDTLYHGNVSRGNPERFVFLIEDGMNMSAAIRVHVSSSHAREMEPIIFVVKQPEGVISWQVPLVVVNENECEFQYESVARTLCPLRFGGEKISEVVIDVSCSSTDDTYYSLEATLVQEFDLE